MAAATTTQFLISEAISFDQLRHLNHREIVFRSVGGIRPESGSQKERTLAKRGSETSNSKETLTCLEMN